jgi:hypothetical protein
MAKASKKETRGGKRAGTGPKVDPTRGESSVTGVRLYAAQKKYLIEKHGSLQKAVKSLLPPELQY